MNMIKLKELMKEVDCLGFSGDTSIPVGGIHYNSGKIREGDCFMAIRGFKRDGINFLEDAIQRGARAVFSSIQPENKFKDFPWIQVKDDRKALSKIAALFFLKELRDLYCIGITGTNGKTTVTSMVHDIISGEKKIAKIGTLGMEYGTIEENKGLTTPESVDLYSFLARVYKLGCRDAVMEVSSVALELGRVEDISFSQGVFTSFSGDHLDFHKTMKNYLAAKTKLFKNLCGESWAIVNLDDRVAKNILKEVSCNTMTYGYAEAADISTVKSELSLEGTRALLRTPKGNLEIESCAVGSINLSNIMAAVGSAVARGVSLDKIGEGIKRFKGVKGRLDFIYKKDFYVLIDYAHTDNALEKLLISLKELKKNRIILVFGAGGNRDKSKRPRMGKIASEYADYVIITSDNPRDEDPGQIISEIIAGFNRNFTNYHIEEERETAIKKAVNSAIKNDLVVIAGKGHENYQIFKDRVIHFDDFEIAKKHLEGVNG